VQRPFRAHKLFQNAMPAFSGAWGFEKVAACKRSDYVFISQKAPFLVQKPPLVEKKKSRLNIPLYLPFVLI
jgi:hypothetical protein